MTDKADNDKVRTFFHAVMHAKQENNYDTVNRLINELVPSQETSWVSIAYLRGSSSIKTKIIKWDEVFRTVEVLLTDRGENAWTLLRGLHKLLEIE